MDAMRVKLKITNEELRADLIGLPQCFPKYTTQLVNLANQNAQGTRPKVVGQLTQLIQEFPGGTYKEWVEWYHAQRPHAVQDATSRIMPMLRRLKEALEVINEDLVRRWVEDLVLAKTYCGLRVQESVLMRIAKARGLDYRLASPREEAKGIDGFVGNIAVSIKPNSYKAKPMLQESISAKTIYYTKLKNGITVEFDS